MTAWEVLNEGIHGTVDFDRCTGSECAARGHLYHTSESTMTALSVLIPMVWQSRSSPRSDGTELMPVSLENEVISMLALGPFHTFLKIEAVSYWRRAPPGRRAPVRFLDSEDSGLRMERGKVKCRHFLVELFRKEEDVVVVGMGPTNSSRKKAAPKPGP